MEINEKERLLKLLDYALEAIEYWFDGCDVTDETIEENEYFQKECKYFIKKLKNDNNK